jgi:hypothetical protein
MVNSAPKLNQSAVLAKTLKFGSNAVCPTLMLPPIPRSWALV